MLDDLEVRPMLARAESVGGTGIDYDVVKGPARLGKRTDLQHLSGQKLYPVIEFENGATYRDESKEMAATIRAGRLDDKRGPSR